MGGDPEDVGVGVGVGVGVELGADGGAVLGAVEPAGGEAGSVLGAVELAGGEVDGAGAPVLPAVEEVEEVVAVGPAAIEGAGNRATVAATGSDEGVRLHFSAFAVPRRSKLVAAAT